MTTLHDIETSEDIKTLIDRFYDKVNRDELLAPIFNDVAKVAWAAHLPKMYRFWDTMLLHAMSYGDKPYPKHEVLPIKHGHFEHWVALFVATVNENFSGSKSEEAKERAVCIADTFAQRMGVLTDAPALGRLHFSGV